MKTCHPVRSLLSWSSLLVLPLLASPLSHANDIPEDYFAIDSVQVRRTDQGDGKWHEIKKKSPLAKPIGKPAAIEGPTEVTPEMISKIVNIGKEVWKIVEANKPVVNVVTDTANALPKGVTAPSELDSWKGPTTAHYEVVYTNKFGADVVTLEYVVSFEHSGKADGKGNFIANATIIPENVRVLWGYTFNADVKVTAVTNQGTKEDPMAALGLLFHWTVKNPLIHTEETAAFTLRGDGSLTAVQN